MAQKVDLMVIGVTDGLSEKELTERLVAEFGQSAEVFNDLVSAACSGGGAYAAQSSVTMDTATQGKEQLERLGVVCQMLVDGNVVGDEPVADEGIVNAAAEVPDGIAQQAEITADLRIADLPPEPEAAEPEPLELELTIEPPAAEPPAVEAVEDESPAVETDNHLPVTGGLELVDVSFSDELGLLGPGRDLDESKLPDTNPEDHLPTQNGLELVDVNFNDELGSLDQELEELKKQAAAKKEILKIKQSRKANSGADGQSVVDPQSANDVSARDLSLADESEAINSPESPLPDEPSTDKPLAVDTSAPLELTLSTDDSQPLTKPKVKGNTVVDDGGLTLSSDDEIAITGAVTQDQVEVKDTRRESKEEIAPLAEEHEADEPAKEDHKDNPGHQQVASATVGAATVDKLIEDLTSGVGGLVLPGQAAADDIPDRADVEKSTDETSDTQITEPVSDEAEVAELSVRIQESIYEEEGDHLESLVVKEQPFARLYKVAAAAAVFGLAGGGAFYMYGPASNIESPTATVAVLQVNESSKFDKVEEVSLNAAIERSSTIKNPDQYSTEELIAYLSTNIGESAQLELENYVNGKSDSDSSQATFPRMGAAIPADSKSVLWLKNRVKHPADTYFDQWAKREVDLKAFLELQERLIKQGDLDVATDVSISTNDKWFAVMSQQRLARAYNEMGQQDKAVEVLELAEQGTYAIPSDSERVIVIADYALTEHELGLTEDSLDSFLKAAILARSLGKPESRTVGLSAVAEYFQKVNRMEESAEYLDLAMVTAYELPVNTAARDLAIRQLALVEVRLGLTDQATEHANLIVDPFAAVSALHGIALELESTGDLTNARLTLNMAYRAGSLIQNSDKRDRLLEKIKLAGG